MARLRRLLKPPRLCTFLSDCDPWLIVAAVRPFERSAVVGRTREHHMRNVFRIGGFVAAVVLIAFGIVAIVMGVNGRSTVQKSKTSIK